MSLMDKKTLYDAKCLRRAMKVHNTVYFIHDYVCVVKVSVWSVCPFLLCSVKTEQVSHYCLSLLPVATACLTLKVGRSFSGGKGGEPCLLFLLPMLQLFT